MPRIRSLAAFCLLFLIACVVGCAATPGSDPADLVWRPGQVGQGCEVQAVKDLPAAGDASLRFITVSQPEDKRADNAVAQALIERRDRKPIATLGQLTQPGASLRFHVYRDASTGEGFPTFTTPYLFLVVAHPDGATSRLLWESAYNGYPPTKKAVVPTNQWLTLDVTDGIFWPQTDPANFNMGTGFQKLPRFASGFQTTRKDGKTSPAYGPDSPIVAIGVGSGPNLPGRMLMFVGRVELTFPGGETRVFRP